MVSLSIVTTTQATVSDKYKISPVDIPFENVKNTEIQGLLLDSLTEMGSIFSSPNTSPVDKMKLLSDKLFKMIEKSMLQNLKSSPHNAESQVQLNNLRDLREVSPHIFKMIENQVAFTNQEPINNLENIIYSILNIMSLTNDARLRRDLFNEKSVLNKQRIQLAKREMPKLLESLRKMVATELGEFPSVVPKGVPTAIPTGVPSAISVDFPSYSDYFHHEPMLYSSPVVSPYYFIVVDDD